MGLPYVPRITVGKLASTQELDEVYAKVKDIDAKFACRITKISVEMIGKNDESIVVIEKLIV